MTGKIEKKRCKMMGEFSRQEEDSWWFFERAGWMVVGMLSEW